MCFAESRWDGFTLRTGKPVVSGSDVCRLGVDMMDPRWPESAGKAPTVDKRDPVSRSFGVFVASTDSSSYTTNTDTRRVPVLS